jgi:predicted 3-demethylubiquinone-9 3-methyltransferase (glyoxalase superfamily)
MTPNKIIPTLWFSAHGGYINEILEYYQAIFDSDFEAGKAIVIGANPSGHSEICNITLFGQKYMLMNTEKEHHAFNDAISLTLNCEDQTEIDKFWDYFTKEGKEVQCGWCHDRYSLRWQVIPKNFNELMSRPNSMKVMMSQKKIVIEEYLK